MQFNDFNSFTFNEDGTLTENIFMINTFAVRNKSN